MGFHICITNEHALPISISKGVYGNVAKVNENRSIVWGKIKDLYAVKPGDLVILYLQKQKFLLVFLGIQNVEHLNHF